jgi:hypothetical protein
MACLIGVIIYAIISLIILMILEFVFAQFFPLPSKVIMLIRLLVGLLLLLYALSCFGVLGEGPTGSGPFFRHGYGP